MTEPDISVKIIKVLRLFPIEKKLLYCQNICIKTFSKEKRLILIVKQLKYMYSIKKDRGIFRVPIKKATM